MEHPKREDNTWIEHPKKKERIPGWKIPRRKTECLDGKSQEERQNTWDSWKISKRKTECLDGASKVEDTIPGWNIPKRKTEYLIGTSQERRQNTWIEHPKKEVLWKGGSVTERGKCYGKVACCISQEGMEGGKNTSIEHIKKEDTIPVWNLPRTSCKPKRLSFFHSITAMMLPL